MAYRKQGYSDVEIRGVNLIGNGYLDVLTAESIERGTGVLVPIGNNGMVTKTAQIIEYGGNSIASYAIAEDGQVYTNSKEYYDHYYQEMMRERSERDERIKRDLALETVSYGKTPFKITHIREAGMEVIDDLGNSIYVNTKRELKDTVERLNAMNGGRGVTVLLTMGLTRIDDPSQIFQTNRYQFDHCTECDFTATHGTLKTTSMICSQLDFSKELEMARTGQSLFYQPQDIQQNISVTPESVLAHRCIDNGKSPCIISGFDPNSIRIVNDRLQTEYSIKVELVEAISIIGKELKRNGAVGSDRLSEILGQRGLTVQDLNYVRRDCGITIEDMMNGVHIKLDYKNLYDVASQTNIKNETINIPHLQDIDHSNGELTLESRSKCFTSLKDMVPLWTQLKIDRNMEQGQSYDQSFNGQNDHFYSPGDLGPIGFEDGPGNR